MTIAINFNQVNAPFRGVVCWPGQFGQDVWLKREISPVGWTQNNKYVKREEATYGQRDVDRSAAGGMVGRESTIISNME